MNKHEMVCYETDASRLKGIVERVIFPKTVEEVQNIIKIAKIDIVPRGAGTGLVGGSVPYNSIVVDMGKMNKVTNFIPSRKSVRVEAGTTLKELNEKLNAIGFEFPIDSSNKGIGTIGGMIARNSSGERSMRYGNMRDWLEEIEFVNGRGELMKTSKADLTDVCGMEGITGIIVAATLKVTPIIKRSASAFQTDNLDEVLSIARKLKSEREVVLLELFSPYVSKLLGLPEKYNLIIEFNSERGKIKGEDYDEISKLRENAFYKLASEGYCNMEDPKFFYDKLKEFIVFLEENKIPYIGHLGAGIIHPYFKDSEKRKKEFVIEFIKKTKATPGRFGIGTTRKYFIDGFQEKLIERVKARHDPFYKLNKGKIIGIQSYEIHHKVNVVKDEKPSSVSEETEGQIEKAVVIVEKKETRKEITGEELSAIEIIRETSECDKTSSLSLDNEGKASSLSKDNEGKASSLSLDNEGQEKTPEEKLDNFIKEIELKEKINASSLSKDNEGQEKIEEEIKKEPEIIEEKPLNELSFQEDKESPLNELSFQEVRDKLKDYEDTFTSELKEGKVHDVEEIARKIPREIVRNEIEFRPREPRERVKVDYKQIQDIMTNRVGNNKENAVSEDKLIDGEEVKIGKVSVSDNLDRKNELSQEDKDLINKILGNRYKKDENKGGKNNN